MMKTFKIIKKIIVYYFGPAKMDMRLVVLIDYYAGKFQATGGKYFILIIIIINSRGFIKKV
jgi:hypothetical protein